MANKIVQETFRSTFKAVDREVLHWFPGHMGKGLKSMQQKLRSIDCIIEVHDARIPMSGRNSEFKYTISGVKPHILVLNKVDLIPKHYIGKISDKLKNECKHVVFTNANDRHCKGVNSLFPLAQNLINSSDRYNRSQEDDCCMMIVGVPNVGKSSIINALRIKYLGRGKATPVGKSAGITRSVLNKIKLSEDPLFYMLDTPGILTPKVPDTETGLKLALCGTTLDHLVGITTIADYLLYWLNKQNYSKNYVDYFEIEKPTDNILEFLIHISKIHNKMLKVKDHLNQYVLKPDLNHAAQIVVRAFREGKLGKFMLDENLFR